MRNIFLIVLLSFINKDVFSQKSFNTKISAEEISIWAMMQHADIEKKLKEKLENNMLKIEWNKRVLDIYETYSLFNCYEQNPYGEPYLILNNNKTFSIVYIEKMQNNFKIKLSYIKDTLTILTPNFQDFLNDESMLYFEMFNINNKLNIYNLKNKSKDIYNNLYFKTYNFSLNNKCKLYRNVFKKDSLNSSEILKIDKIEYVVYINTDTTDLTIGHDSVIAVDFNPLDTSVIHQIFCENIITKNNFKVSGISCSKTSQNSKYQRNPYHQKIGYIINNLLSDFLINDEVHFIEILNINYITCHLSYNSEYEVAKNRINNFSQYY